MAESGAESSSPGFASFTHLKRIQEAAHIYTLTTSSNRDGCCCGSGRETKATPRFVSASLFSRCCRINSILTLFHFKNCQPSVTIRCSKRATCVVFFIFFDEQKQNHPILSPGLQPASAHVGRNGRVLSAVEVVIIRHGARHRGGAHCSARCLPPSQPPQKVSSLFILSERAPPCPLLQQPRAVHTNGKRQTLQPVKRSDVIG